MVQDEMDDNPPSKRRKIAANVVDATTHTPNPEVAIGTTEVVVSRSLRKPISPPPSRRVRSKTPDPSTPRKWQQQQPLESQPQSATFSKHESEQLNNKKESAVFLPSPIQLTRVKDLAPGQNVDAVGLKDILGDPMIKECWNFNFLFDIDFVMQHFDPDIRDLVKVKIVHGFWKREDGRRHVLQEAAETYPNVELISAYMPDPFGTHHSKMLILFRHDDQAQIIIHTANMISRDWGNMSQAVWRSPLLPLWSQAVSPSHSQAEPQVHSIGSGERFRTDLLSYLNAYGKRLTALTRQLTQYDFSAIRAAFIGSAPSRQKLNHAKPSVQTSFGWIGLREILSSIPISSAEDSKSNPNIIIQISSIATLGPTLAWLTHFQSVLSSFKPSSTSSTPSTTSMPPSSSSPRKDFFTPRCPSKPKQSKPPPPKFNIIFPTAHEIRTSLDGYASGASIHTKIQSATQEKQLQYLRPLFCHWRHFSDDSPLVEVRKAERGAAAPHIKTYIRFTDEKKQDKIDWAMVTSANLSKQAWGEVENKNGEIWIQSWETGVVVWPALFSPSFPSSSAGEAVEMVPVFKKDMPAQEDVSQDEEESEGNGEKGGKRKMVVGFRMPYDLPLEPYKQDEVPWCATLPDAEPDWKGQVWKGY